MGNASRSAACALATAIALAAGALWATPAGAEEAPGGDPLPRQLLPRVDAPPPSLARSSPPAPRLWTDQDELRVPGHRQYHSREDRAAEELLRRRKGRWRELRYNFDMKVGDDEYEVRLRAPGKKAVKSRLLSAGVEIRF